MTFRLFAAACLLTATLGCQPESDPNVSTDLDVDLGESSAPIDGAYSNTTAVGELPDSNITGTAEVPAVTETPDAVDTPAVIEVPATEPTEAEEPAATTTEEAPPIVD